MRIVFSRKGFDSSYGGAPSPIVDGCPLFLPIPTTREDCTDYGSLGLGSHVESATRGRLTAASVCHDDPMFCQDLCWLGQAGAAQGHLRKQGVTEGDVFLFFGLFAEPETQERHHRIFGHMRVACHGSPEEVSRHRGWTPPPRPHPHFAGEWDASNTIYHGPGGKARRAGAALRLTQPGGPLNSWTVPPWLGHFGLSYHGKPDRWRGPTSLDSVKRGQEFVCDIGDADEPRRWLAAILAEIEG